MLKSNITVAENPGYLSIFILPFIFNNIAQNFSWTQGHPGKRLYLGDSVPECGCEIKFEPVRHKCNF